MGALARPKGIEPQRHSAGFARNPISFESSAFSASGHVSVRGRSARGGAHAQNSPALCAGEPLIPRFAAAEAAATTPASVPSDGRDTHRLWRPPPRSHISLHDPAPRRARGWIGKRASARHDHRRVRRKLSSGPPTPSEESSPRAQKLLVSSTENAELRDLCASVVEDLPRGLLGISETRSGDLPSGRRRLDTPPRESVSRQSAGFAPPGETM